MKEKQVGDKVVIIGGGEVGCEMGVEFASQGKQVTIVEIAEDILMAPSFVANKQNIRYLVDHSGVKVYTATATKLIRKDDVLLEKDGQSIIIAADTVIFSTGFRSDHILYEQMMAKGIEVVEVGDARKPGKVIDAIHQAYHCVRVYE